MGVVYRAERADGLYERSVALKRIRPGLGESLASRLEAERALLARLEHSGIARLYDGGVDDAGAPYVVMELVDGLPITEHADAHDLEARERAALFVQVCDAVAYAHGHLIVHRDLKPTNVLVVAGPPATVKLLDFGIARILGDEEAGAFAQTLTRTQAAMTPSYAAPEQLRRGVVTTATDVYALGVMLYELLAGRRPYSLAGASPAEAERIVCDTDPAAPSTVAPAGRARALRGDLDTIVAKALEKDPARRYPSAEALADDLRRHLDGLPVKARPLTAGYRTARFVRRHRAGVAGATAVTLALLAGLAGTAWQARAARTQAARAEAVNSFLVDLFNSPNPEVEGRDVRVASLLDRAAATLDSTQTAPDHEATLRHTLGITYRGLGLFEEADEQLRRALALRTRLRGDAHPDVAEVQESLARALVERGEYAEAESLLSRAHPTARRHDGAR
jgi:serine/threonine-protein kinase